MPSKRKTNKARKTIDMRGKQRKQKVKFKTAVALLTPQKIVLSGYAQTSEADILHLEQKAGKCSSY